MISDSVLSACIYIPPAAYRLSPTSSLLSLSPASLALTTLLTLSSIVSRFDGISSMGSAHEESFKELRKGSYLALDILTRGPKGVAERLVDELTDRRTSVLTPLRGSQEIGHTQVLNKRMY